MIRDGSIFTSVSEHRTLNENICPWPFSARVFFLIWAGVLLVLVVEVAVVIISSSSSSGAWTSGGQTQKSRSFAINLDSRIAAFGEGAFPYLGRSLY